MSGTDADFGTERHKVRDGNKRHKWLALTRKHTYSDRQSTNQPS
jgi:hypothetical protein